MEASHSALIVHVGPRGEKDKYLLAQKTRNILFIQASPGHCLVLKSEIFQVCHNCSLYCQKYNINKMRGLF